MPEDTKVEEPHVVKTPAQRDDMPPDLVAELMEGARKAGQSSPEKLAELVQRVADAQAKRRVNQLLEENDRTWQITELAAKLTGDGSRALPIKVSELATFFMSLNPDQFQAAKRIFETITENGIIEFSEYGHGRRLRRQPLPAEYHDALKSVLAAGNSAESFFAELGMDPGQFDLSPFVGGK